MIGFEMGRSASQARGDFAPLLTAEVGGGDATPTTCVATCSDNISRKYAATQRDRKLRASASLTAIIAYQHKSSES